MNKRDLLIKRNRIRQLIRVSNRNKNVLKWGANETDEHIQMKLEICKYLKRENQEFYTEAIFENNQGRADIVWADKGIIIEVINSETEKSTKEKDKKYPLDVIFVDADQVFEPELIL